MKSIILLISLTIGASAGFAQTTEWSKTDRNDIYEEFLNAIKNKNITTEQKESLALCFLDQVTKKYTKAEYQAKLDIEVKKIRETATADCSKNLGLDLSDKPKPETQESAKTTKKVNEGNFTREDLVGSWRNENAKLFFNQDNTFVAKGDNGDSFGSTWYINKEKNIVIENYGTLYVKSFDGNTLKYKQTLKTKVLGVTTKKKDELFTAMRME